MKSFFFIFLAVVLICGALAAPAEGEAEEKKDDTSVSKPADKKSEREVVVKDETWQVWLRENTWNIVTAGLGAILIAGGIAVGVYYYYYVTANYGRDAMNPNGNMYGQPQSQQGYYAQTGRSLDVTPGSPWNFTKVLEYIDIAQKTYEGFDWQNLDCQKRTLCELAQKDTWVGGETGRKISNNYLLTVMDALDGIPIPRVIQAYLAEYKDALTQGKNTSKSCGDIYKKCKFSIKEVFAQVGQKKANGL